GDPNHFGKYVVVKCYPGATKILAVIQPQASLDLDGQACLALPAVTDDPSYRTNAVTTMYSNDSRVVYCTNIIPTSESPAGSSVTSSASPSGGTSTDN